MKSFFFALFHSTVNIFLLNINELELTRCRLYEGGGGVNDVMMVVMWLKSLAGDHDAMGLTKWNEMNWREETYDDDNDIINTPADGTAHSTAQR